MTEDKKPSADAKPSYGKWFCVGATVGYVVGGSTFVDGWIVCDHLNAPLDWSFLGALLKGPAMILILGWMFWPIATFAVVFEGLATVVIVWFARRTHSPVGFWAMAGLLGTLAGLCTGGLGLPLTLRVAGLHSLPRSFVFALPSEIYIISANAGLICGVVTGFLVWRCRPKLACPDAGESGKSQSEENRHEP